MNLNLNLSQETPRRNPRGTQEASRRHPGGTQETARITQEHPGAPKRHPAGTKDAPRTTQEPPRSTQDAPRRYPGDAQGHQRLQDPFYIQCYKNQTVLKQKVAQPSVSRRRQRRDPHRSRSLRTEMRGRTARPERFPRQGPLSKTVRTPTAEDCLEKKQLVPAGIHHGQQLHQLHTSSTTAAAPRQVLLSRRLHHARRFMLLFGLNVLSLVFVPILPPWSGLNTLACGC